MAKVFLSVGSNLGNRFEFLQSAVDQLEKNSQVSNLKVSSVYETKPFGGPEQDDFLNAVIEIETQLSPNELLEFTQTIEKSANRIREVHWGPRTLDVDILDYEGTTLDSQDLILPHPRISQRAFVLIPWSELSPNTNVSGVGVISDLVKAISTQDVKLNTRMQLKVNN